MTKANKTDISVAVEELATLKAKIKELTDAKSEIEQQIVAGMSALGQQTITGSDGTKATVVVGTRYIIDNDALKAKLGAAMWRKVTRLVLDEDKLQAHVTTGDIPIATVSAVTEEVHNRPYVRLTARKTAAPAKAPARAVRRPKQ